MIYAIKMALVNPDEKKKWLGGPKMSVHTTSMYINLANDGHLE